MVINYSLVHKSGVMRNKLLTLSFLVSSFYLPSLMAFELGVGTRSMGQVVELGNNLGESFNVRIAFAADYKSGDVEYNSPEEIKVESVLSGEIGQWKTSHSSLLIDYHPWQRNFRFSLGLSDSSLTWKAKNSGAVSIGGNPIPEGVLDSVVAEVQFTDGVSPYIGLGWATGFDKANGLSFNGDFGLLVATNFVVLFDANCIEGQVVSEGCEVANKMLKTSLQSFRIVKKLVYYL